MDRTKSTTTSLYVYWSAVTGGSIPVDGYLLYMSEKGEGQLQLIYDGSNNAATLAYNVTGLETGKYYSFYIQARNFNGLSEESDELQSVVCNSPSFIQPVYYITSTTSSITVGWIAPEDDGGCPIITYELYRNDGLTGTTTTLVDDTAIRGKPYLSSYSVGGLINTGNSYKFKIMAYNEIGSVESEETSIVLAAVPAKPSAAPTQDYT